MILVTVTMTVTVAVVCSYHEQTGDLNITSSLWEDEVSGRVMRREMKYIKVVGLPGLAQTRVKKVMITAR